MDLYFFQEPNPEDPLNKDAAEVLQSNRRMFEQNVAKAMRGGYVGQYYFQRCLKWYSVSSFKIIWIPSQRLTFKRQILKCWKNAGSILVFTCVFTLYILTFFSSCQASKHLIHQVFYAFG